MTTGQLVGISIGAPIVALMIGAAIVKFIRGFIRYYRENRPMATRLGKPDPRCARNPAVNKHGRVE